MIISLQKQKTFFDAFISHKQSTASQLARTVKTFLTEIAREREKTLSIFLDVDNLPESTLKELEDTVKRTNNLILLITKDVEKSKWVAQEIIWAPSIMSTS